ncbi:hypothetical protein [Streptomyces orinoci]|uniref:Uncharacterized protein n=1 Tax=Streptomyces orinoci TaxID=67339 RepID=A0ABV3K4P7_STRON|nr:hypothetical protein [Streptomyces orinoci]
MSAGRGGKTPAHRKAIPRDMQDQQADAAPQRGPADQETSRKPKSTENIDNARERASGTSASDEPQRDEPPD